LTAKTTKKSAKAILNECALTGCIFDGRFSPLRLSLDNDQLMLALTDKKVNDAIFIDADIKIIKAILSGQRQLPEIYQALIPQDLQERIIDLYTKKFYASLGFLLKTGQAVIGRRAIDRAMFGYGEAMPLAVLLTPQGSQAICNSFKFKQPNLRIIENFSQDLLIKITGREKISYYCILNTEMGIVFLNDYIKYLKLIDN
jgi:hypothetical protein